MKKTLGLILILAACPGVLMAQKSQYFTYDKERVDQEMAMITETTVTQGSFDLMAGDSVKKRKIPNQAFILIGVGSGCLGTLAGFYIGSIINAPNLFYVGGGLGILVPALIAGLRSHKEVTDPTKTPEEVAGLKIENRNNAAKTALGGIAGVAGCVAVTGVAAVIIVYWIIVKVLRGLSG